MKIYVDAYKMRQKNEDAERWLMGSYVHIAVASAMDTMLNGRKATVKYPERPMLQENESKYEDGSELSQEEKDAICKQLVENLSSMQKNFEEIHGKRR